MIAILLAALLLGQGAPVAPARPGAVTGQIRTIDGAPAVSVTVAALREPTGFIIPADGPNYFDPAPASTALTDSQGRFRLENVPPGRYYIRAGLTDLPTFYPAGAAITGGEGATVVTVDPGGTTSNISFRLLWPIGSTVSGRIVSAEGAQLPGTLPGTLATLSGSRVEELLEVPVTADGSFRFGSVLPGLYLLSLFPPPPGFVGTMARVGDEDITGIELRLPPTRSVSGRIGVDNGTPVPRGILAFYTPQSYVAATIHPDGTFSAQLHPGRHRIDVAGMPVGYRFSSARIGAQDVDEGLDVEDADVQDLVVTVASRPALPSIRGRIAGLDGNRLSAVTLELTGPIYGTLRTVARDDGSFEFGSVPPGLYVLRTPQVADIPPRLLAVEGRGVVRVLLTLDGR